jgi:hypothetical protein
LEAVVIGDGRKSEIREKRDNAKIYM